MIFAYIIAFYVGMAVLITFAPLAVAIALVATLYITMALGYVAWWWMRTWCSRTSRDIRRELGIDE